jgi:quercetin dioxygenase-like cupin family protein
MAQQAKVTSLMSKDLTENPGKEALMITVEHAPGGSDPVHRHNAEAFVYVLEGSPHRLYRRRTAGQDPGSGCCL